MPRFDLKSVNLQYMLVCRANGTNKLSTKHLMFQVSIFSYFCNFIKKYKNELKQFLQRIQGVIRREPKIECYAKEKGKTLPFFFYYFTTISSHFFDTNLYIFHKTAVQTIILRCWTDLNHNWFKRYDTKCKLGNTQ